MLSGAVAAEAAILYRFFNKFKKDELVDIVNKLDLKRKVCGDGDGDSNDGESDIASMTKADIVGGVTNCFGTGISFTQIAIVDMAYNQMRSGGRKWQALKLAGAKGSEGDVLKIGDPDALKKSLSKNLGFFLDHHLETSRHQGTIWIRIFLQDSVGPESQLVSNSNTIYVIYLPHSPYLLATQIKKGQRDFVSQALVTTFNCTRVEEIDLSGKDTSSLSDLLLNKLSQGQYGDYRLGHYDSNPLSRTLVQPKRKRAEDSVSDGKVLLEHKEDDQKRDDFATSTFGKYEPPKLQKSEFSLSTKYRGDAQFKMDGLMECNVKLEGTSIVAGLKQFVRNIISSKVMLNI